MTEGLTGGISPESREALRRFSDTLPEVQESDSPQEDENISLKDAPYREVLETHPELERTIASTMDTLARAGLPVPVFHVTSRAIRFPDGSEVSSGYLESIARSGFRARDTNVAALMERDASARIADPNYFAHNPHKFLRAMAESLSRYAHHGSRTNKETLGEYREAGVGVPTMAVIDASGVSLVPGSDYDDHFLLGDLVPPSHIVGMVDLADRRPINLEDMAVLPKSSCSAQQHM